MDGRSLPRSHGSDACGYYYCIIEHKYLMNMRALPTLMPSQFAHGCDESALHVLLHLSDPFLLQMGNASILHV